MIPGISMTGDGVGMSGDGQYMIIRGTNSYISTNGGSTWSKITSVELGGGHRPNVAMSYTGKYMLATENPTGINNYFSSDFGATWTTRVIIPASASTETAEKMSAYRAAMSSDGKFMVIASNREKYFYSSDFGATFVQSTVGSYPQYTETVSISNDGKYILTSDNGAFYVDVNNISQVTPSLTVSSFGAGVIHSDASGILTSSKVVTNDISNNAVTPAKLDRTYALDASLNAVSTSLNSYAPKASPTFTGIVTLPVPTDASSNEAATTSFVMNKLYDVSNNKFTIVPAAISQVIATVGAMVFSSVDQKLYVCAQDPSGNAVWFDVGATKVV
jgi:glutathionyl-hydroquinone reductase